MRTFWRKMALAAALALPSLAYAANTYPIVLVHGFGGWGRGELFGLKYWGGGLVNGGNGDLEAVLTNNGTLTKTAAVGPLSSNWDRAVELFYQIKGGCVDYGPYHSTHLYKTDGTLDSRTIIRKLDGGTNPDGSKRPRRCWAKDAANNPNNDPLALYPQWGNDSTKKIHLVAHSQGGQTVRMLLQLLRNGAPNELAADNTLNDESTQPNPFKGGKNWVSSITTLASPHDGTTLASGVQMLGIVQQLAGAAAAVAGLSSHDTALYDMKLDQWGLKRTPGESFTSYFNRVKASPIWSESKNVSLWDLSPDGAKELNQKVAHFNDVYYFSYQTSSTYKGLFGKQYPIVSTFLPFQPQSLFMGWYTRSGVPNRVDIDSSWWENDSVVNSKSMLAPSGAPLVTYNGTPQIGKWNFMGKKKHWDHVDIIGVLCGCNINPIYIQHANTLKTLSN